MQIGPLWRIEGASSHVRPSRSRQLQARKPNGALQIDDRAELHVQRDEDAGFAQEEKREEGRAIFDSWMLRRKCPLVVSSESCILPLLYWPPGRGRRMIERHGKCLDARVERWRKGYMRLVILHHLGGSSGKTGVGIEVGETKNAREGVANRYGVHTSVEHGCLPQAVVFVPM